MPTSMMTDRTPETAVLVRLLAEQQALIENLRREKDEVAKLLSEQIAKLKSQIDWLNRQLFGRKSEKIDPNQQWFDGLTIQAIEGNAPAAPAPAVETKVEAHVRKCAPHGRGELPAHLPREIEIIDVPESEKMLPDGSSRPVIGHEDTEMIACTPAKIFVKVTRRMKYGSPVGAEEHGVVVAPVPERLLPRCLADESLLAHLGVSKYADHLPLNRMEKILKRSGINLTRQTMCDWLVDGGLKLQALVDQVAAQMFATGLVHHDDTPVDLQDYKSGKPRGERMREARFWATTAAPREGPWVVYDFTLSRAADGPVRFLRDFKGRVVCDAYKIYECFEKLDLPLTPVGCWAHVRRYFLEAHRSSHPAEGAEFVAMIRELYLIERGLVDSTAPEGATPAERTAIRVADDAKREATRREHSAPVLDRIRKRMEELGPTTPPCSKLGKALSYATRIWERLTLYVEDGRLPIDNNPAEQMIRPIALGRNNWLFLGSERGGKAAANWMSIIATCKRANVEPFAYLSDVLRRLPVATTPEQVRQLLPDVWKPQAT